MIPCDVCGFINNPNAKFCGQCGRALTSPLAAAAPAAGQVAPVPQPAQAAGQAIPVAPPPVPAFPPAGAPAAVPGAQLLRNRYLIIRRFGQGGMGAVYLAQDQNAFNRRCVVKEMLPYYSSLAEKQKAEADFEREARVLATLRYDGVPQIYDYFTEQGNYYLVMEYVEGENLEEKLTRLGGKLPLEEALDYGLQLATTLVYLAKQTPPVIHRDIKPANIILDEQQGKLKLVDFGLAKQNVAGGQTGTLSAPLGTPGYAPLEQYTGHVEPRTDVFALGATLHHLITGRDPRVESGFDYPPVSQLLPGVPPILDELIARMLESRVVDRPAATEVRDVLEALIAPKSLVRADGARLTGFAFRSGPVAMDEAELAILCDSHWQDGIYHLYEGHLEPWLETINRRDLAVRAESIRKRGGDPSVGLEEFLRAANPTIPLPSLAVSATSLDAGAVERGAAVPLGLQIKNSGRGCLTGRIAARAGWVAVRPSDFSLMPNQELAVAVTLITAQLAEGPFDETALAITSNGGQAAVACRAEVTWQPELSLEPRRRLHLGDLIEGAGPSEEAQPVSAPLLIRNTGGSTLQGQIVPDAPWLAVSPDSFQIPSGGSLTVQVTGTLPADSLQMVTGRLRVESSAGAQEIQATVRVRRDWYTDQNRALLWARYLGLVGVGYVGQVAALALPVIALLLGGVGWRQWLLAAGAFVLSLGALYLSRPLAGRLDELEQYYHGGDLRAALDPGRFTVRALALPAAVGALIGGLFGWLFAVQTGGSAPVWTLLSLLVGALAGALLAAHGQPSLPLPASLIPYARGATLDESPVAAALRAGLLTMAGAWLGLILDPRVDSGRWIGAWAGALVGLLLSSDGHLILTPRLRWILERVRLALLMGLAAWVAVAAALPLMGAIFFRSAADVDWGPVQFYRGVASEVAGLRSILWMVGLLMAGFGGGRLGLLVGGDAGLAHQAASRLYRGLFLLMLAAGGLVYILFSILRAVLPEAAVSWIELILTAAAIGFALWALLVRRTSVETLSGRAQGIFSRGLQSSRQLAQGQQGRLSALGSVSAPPWLRSVGRRVRAAAGRVRVPASWRRWLSALSLPTLAEIEQAAPVGLAAGAGLAALVVVPPAAQLVTSVVLGLGIVFVILLAAALLAVAARLIVLRLRATP